MGTKGQFTFSLRTLMFIPKCTRAHAGLSIKPPTLCFSRHSSSMDLSSSRVPSSSKTSILSSSISIRLNNARLVLTLESPSSILNTKCCQSYTILIFFVKSQIAKQVLMRTFPKRLKSCFLIETFIFGTFGNPIQFIFLEVVTQLCLFPE